MESEITQQKSAAEYSAMCGVPGCERHGELRDGRFGRLCAAHGRKVKCRTDRGWPDPYKDIEKDARFNRITWGVCQIPYCETQAARRDARFTQICIRHYERIFWRKKRGVSDPYSNLEIDGNPTNITVLICTYCNLEFERPDKATRRKKGKDYKYFFCCNEHRLQWLRDGAAKGWDHAPRGINHPSSKLTPFRVSQIRKAIALGKGKRGIKAALADNYNVTRQTVQAIDKNKIWKDIGVVRRCISCGGVSKKYGRDRHGTQRWMCHDCSATFLDESRANNGKTASADLMYPFRPTDESSADDLTQQIVTIVPKWYPEHVRQEICQEIAVSVLTGNLTVDAISGAVKEYVKHYYKMFPEKYGDMSLDHPAPGDPYGRTLGEMISE